MSSSSTFNWKGIIIGALLGLLIAWILNITFQFVVGLILGFQLRGISSGQGFRSAWRWSSPAWCSHSLGAWWEDGAGRVTPRAVKL